MKPKSDEGEEKYYRRKMFNTPEPKPRDIKLRSYLVQYKGDEFQRGHEVIIMQEYKLYTGKIKFACQMTDKEGCNWWTSEKKSKDLQAVKDYIREFLGKFGEYTITPNE